MSKLKITRELLLTMFILTICIGNIHGGIPLEIGGFYQTYRTSSLADVSLGGDLLTNMVFSLADGNEGTGAYLNTAMKGRSFRIVLKKAYPVDKIVFKCDVPGNIAETFTNSLPVVLKVTGQISNEKGYEGKYELLDVAGVQELELGKEMEAKEWVFQAVTNKSKNKGIYTFINEIEFWYHGEKYEAVNLESAKAEFLAGAREEKLEFVTNMMGYIRRVEFQEAGTNVLGRWEGLGVETGNVYGEQKTVYGIPMEFTRDATDGYGGKILAARKGGEYYPVKDEKTGFAVYHFRESVQIGEWKIDEKAVMWVRVGKGEWKKSEGDLSFIGTDMGMLRGILSLGSR